MEEHSVGRNGIDLPKYWIQPPTRSLKKIETHSNQVIEQFIRHNSFHVAESGAKRVLVDLGLENGHAARDIGELRSLLEAQRDARCRAWQTAVKVVTTRILAALLVGAAINLKLMGAPQ